MSKDEMKPARIDRRLSAAHERIEELEREIERKMSAADFILKERDALQADRDEWKARAEFSYRQLDELNRLCEFNEKTMSALQADNARLWEALEYCVTQVGELATIPGIASALAATPEQSLAASELRKERDQLRAHINALRDAIKFWMRAEGNYDLMKADKLFQEALAATPEQSLARIRNQVREECAVVGDDYATYSGAHVARVLRATKEPE